MLLFHGNSTYEEYTATYHHWCPQSESYAGGDQLFSAYRTGWELEGNVVYAEQEWKGGRRPVTVYYFVLVRDDEVMIMPVVRNPFVERYITQQLMTVVYDAEPTLNPDN